MRILVIGGTGFIGRHLVARLAAATHEILVPTRFYKKGRDLLVHPPVTLLQEDVHDDAALGRMVAGCDAVINLVGILHGRTGHPYGPDFDLAHVRLPRRIGRVCREAGVKRLLHVSALGASADAPSMYLRSKAAGEAALREACSDGPALTLFRPSVVFGPEDRFLNLFARLARVLPVLPVARARSRLQPVYVGDVAEAIVRALFDPAAAGQTYEIGGPKVYSFKELMELTLAEIKKKRLLLPVPGALLKPAALLMELQPLFAPPITRDQIELLKSDNVVSAGAKTLADLGIDHPVPVEGIIESYLYHYRRGGGRFQPRFS